MYASELKIEVLSLPVGFPLGSQVLRESRRCSSGSTLRIDLLRPRLTTRLMLEFTRAPWTLGESHSGTTWRETSNCRS